MKVYVQCQAAIDLSPEQIRAMVDPGITIPPGGILKAWVAGHEGVSRPMVEGANGWESSPISWGKAAVQQITRAIKIAAAKMRSFWDGHPDGEEQPDRKSFGRIVGGGEIEKNGKLYSVVVGHFPDSEKAIAENSDVISMEAFWNVVKNGANEIATGVDEIFGFALARSSEASPGFPGAHEIRAIKAYQRKVYAFAEAEPQEKRKLDFSSVDPKEIPIDLIKRALVAKSIRVHDLYEPEDVFGEAKKLADGSTTFLGGSKKFQAYLVDEVAKGRAELQNKIKELEPFQQKATQLEGQVRKFGVLGKVEKAIQDSKLPDVAQKYLKSLTDSFDPGENPDESIKQFIENGKAKYEGIFGPIVKETTKTTPRIPTPATDKPQATEEFSPFGVKINPQELTV